jgi:hypothetical protein
MRRSVLSVLAFGIAICPAFAQWPGSTTVPRAEPSATAPVEAAASAAPAAPASAAAPAPAASVAAGHQLVDTPEISFQIPSGWASEPPQGMMRKAQVKIPAVAPETDAGEITVFNFGGPGGGVDANIDRWFGQFSQADGKPIEPSATKRETFQAGGNKVTMVECAGTMKASSMPGAPARDAKTNYRLVAAIVEVSGGAWFFKGTGPDKTMEGARTEFRAMLDTIKLK